MQFDPLALRLEQRIAIERVELGDSPCASHATSGDVSAPARALAVIAFPFNRRVFS